MEVQETKKKYSLGEYLDAARQLASKWQLSEKSVQKFAAWISLEAGTTTYCNNPLNIRPTSKDDFFYHSGRVNEIINGKVVWADPNNPKDSIRKFKAYKDFASGIEHGLNWLNRNHPEALQYLRDDSKSAKEFALKLGEPDKRGLHYYTANKENYSNGVQARFDQIAKL